MKPMVNTARDEIINGSGIQNDMIQWVNMPHNYNHKEIKKIQSAADNIKNDSSILIVI